MDAISVSLKESEGSFLLESYFHERKGGRVIKLSLKTHIEQKNVFVKRSFCQRKNSYT